MNVLDAVRSGQHDPLEWARLSLSEHVAIEVTTDALMVGGVRRATTPQVAQQLCDVLGCALWTPRISDAVWRLAEVRIDPQTQPIAHPHGAHVCPSCSRETSSPWALCLECGERQHSERIDAALVDAMRSRHPWPTNRSPLISPTGKQWVLAQQLWQPGGGDCYLYGWQRRNGQPWQPLSSAHPLATAHVDYAMFWRAWRPFTPSGSAVDWSPALAELELHDRRIPGVLNA